MKPLYNVEAFLKRFDNFKNGEFRSIEVLSPTKILIILAGQDQARAYDWISLQLEFSDVRDARLLENSKLSLLDMSEGINIIKNETLLAFGMGECYNLSSVKRSACYIESSSIKYQEGLF